MLRVANIVGTRPNLVKIAAMLAAQQARGDSFSPLLIHTGQHRDPEMAARFFDELDLPVPDVALVGHGGSRLQQIGHMQRELQRVLSSLQPDLVVVVGDVNSTAAGALAGSTLGIPVAHVEAGLRSFDPTMPEELNRVLVDEVSDLLFASEASAVTNLVNEGRPAAAIHHVGNVMIDALLRFHPRAADRHPAAELGVRGPYAVLTLHRPSNVDDAGALAALLDLAGRIARRLPVIFPVHPRTRDRLARSGLDASVASLRGLHATAPFGYLDMIALLRGAHLVLTDSGGVQEETTALGVPCLTLRSGTERPATVTHGTNRVVGTQPDEVLSAVERILAGERPAPQRPPLWDGRAAERIVAVLERGGAPAASGCAMATGE